MPGVHEQEGALSIDLFHSKLIFSYIFLFLYYKKKLENKKYFLNMGSLQ